MLSRTLWASCAAVAALFVLARFNWRVERFASQPLTERGAFFAESLAAGCRSEKPVYRDFTTGKGGKPFEEPLVADALRHYCKSPLERTSMVFITATTEDHFEETKDALRGVAACFPGRRTLVYDLGLTRTQVAELSHVCDVDVVAFDWDRYPSHVSFVWEYRFKPIAIHETLFDLRGALGFYPEHIFWIDASVRFLCPESSVWLRAAGLFDSWRPFHRSWAETQSRLLRDGIVFFVGGELKQFQTTPKAMFDFFPTSVETTSRPQWGAGAILLSESVFGPIVAWWTACALEPNCMLDKTDPSEPWFSGDAKVSLGAAKHVYCPYLDRLRGGKISCSRTDQSAINTLTSNAVGEVWKEKGVALALRFRSNFYAPLRFCEPS